MEILERNIKVALVGDARVGKVKKNNFPDYQRHH